MNNIISIFLIVFICIRLVALYITFALSILGYFMKFFAMLQYFIYAFSYGTATVNKSLAKLKKSDKSKNNKKWNLLII